MWPRRWLNHLGRSAWAGADIRQLLKPLVAAALIREAQQLDPDWSSRVHGVDQSEPDAPGRASHGWTPNQAGRFAQLLANAGFVDIQVNEVDRVRRPVVVVSGTKAGR
jgi:hypothetical protein